MICQGTLYSRNLDDRIMKPACAATIFHVKDLDASLNYYKDILGFNVDFRYGDMVGLAFGEVLIYLSGPGQEVKKTPGEGSIYIFCDEVDQYYKDIIAKGAILSIGVEDRGYGMRDFSVPDPDGNFITFGMEIKQ